MVLQMCGRAGRPPFDDTGMVIIMTRRETVHLYENLLNGCEVVESQLLPCITEHLAAEIVQLTISDITKAIEWMKCSYLYVRMKKNPENYAIKKAIPGSIERHIQEICVRKVNELSQYQMIWTDEDGFLLKALEPGRLMTKYYLKFETMKHIMLAPPNSSIEDALHIICRAEEISWIQLRRNEKKLLNNINADKDGRLRFHILGDNGKVKKRIQSREEKIFILANDCLTGDPLVHDLSMSQDMNSICSNGCRISKCMKEYFIYKKNYKGAVCSTLLAKCLHQKLWDDSPYLLKQLPGIGMVTAKALHSMGVVSFESFSDADPRKIEMVTGRKYPFGNHIKESLHSLPPKVEMKLEETENQMQGKSKLIVTLTRISESLPSTKRHYADMMVSIEKDNIILFHEKIRVDEFLSPYSANVLLPTPHQGNLTISADLIFEEFVGIDIHQRVIVEKKMKLNKISDHCSSTFEPKDICMIQDDYKCSYQSPITGGQNSFESKGPSDNMPSFELLQEESDEAGPSAEYEDDECKIITDRTVFDHIREKAKDFPSLAKSRVTCSPSSETLSLIKKRTRERQLVMDSLTEVSHETNKMGDSRLKNVVLSSAQPIVGESCKSASDTDLNLDIFLENDTGHLLPGQEHIEPEALTEETIFNHIRKKSKIFPVLDSSKITGLNLIVPTKGPQVKNQSIFCDFTFDICESFSQTQDPRAAAAISPNPMDIMRPGASGARKVKDIIFSGSSIDRRDKMVNSTQKGVASLSFVKEGLANHASSSENNEDQLSPGLLSRKCCFPETTGSARIQDSFFGFKSVFSFL